MSILTSSAFSSPRRIDRTSSTPSKWKQHERLVCLNGRRSREATVCDQFEGSNLQSRECTCNWMTWKCNARKRNSIPWQPRWSQHTHASFPYSFLLTRPRRVHACFLADLNFKTFHRNWFSNCILKFKMVIKTIKKCNHFTEDSGKFRNTTNHEKQHLQISRYIIFTTST